MVRANGTESSTSPDDPLGVARSLPPYRHPTHHDPRCPYPQETKPGYTSLEYWEGA